MANDTFPGAILRQLLEWGYPQGSTRQTPPARKAFSVVHITGNSRLPSADSELDWRINDPANQNSATFFVNRDGSIRQALGDPLHMDPWSNGDVNQPDRSNPRIAAMVADGVNANERTIVAIENVGYEPGYSLTSAQEESASKIIHYYHEKVGIGCNRQTIIGHYQLNSVTRPNCPARDKDVLDRIAALAASYHQPKEDPKVIEYWKALAEKRAARVALLVAKRDELVAELAAMVDEIAKAEATMATLADLRTRVRLIRDRIVAIKAKVAGLATDVADD